MRGSQSDVMAKECAGRWRKQSEQVDVLNLSLLFFRGPIGRLKMKRTSLNSFLQYITLAEKGVPSASPCSEVWKC